VNSPREAREVALRPLAEGAGALGGADDGDALWVQQPFELGAAVDRAVGSKGHGVSLNSVER
jgi:hypothetical protein